jgi:hypothetical protein
VKEAGFDVLECQYVHRRTVNKKEGLCVPRIFVQARFQRPSAERSTAQLVGALDETASTAAGKAVEVSGSSSNCENAALSQEDVDGNTDTVIGAGVSADGFVNVRVEDGFCGSTTGNVPGAKLVHDTTEQQEQEGINRDLTEKMQSLCTDTQPDDCR